MYYYFILTGSQFLLNSWLKKKRILTVSRDLMCLMDQIKLETKLSFSILLIWQSSLTLVFILIFDYRMARVVYSVAIIIIIIIKSLCYL